MNAFFGLWVAQHLPPLFIVQGVRAAAEQHSLWLKGRDPAYPGPIVTELDGFTKRSNHQVKLFDGFGHAVDVAFLPTPTEHDPWAPLWPWAKLGAQGEALGLVWGGRWKSPVDLDHFELPS
jgi:peptidoglycan L-alanyl-D-glutamate endopeptidase CwlK